MGAAQKALDDRDAESCTRDFVDRYITWVEQNPDRATLLYQAPLVVDLTDVQEAKLQAFAPVVSWIASRAGEVREIVADVLDPVVFGPVHETVRRWLADDRSRPLTALSETLGEAVWRIAQPD
jgi:hypothetical protein